MKIVVAAVALISGSGLCIGQIGLGILGHRKGIVNNTLGVKEWEGDGFCYNRKGLLYFI